MDIGEVGIIQRHPREPNRQRGVIHRNEALDGASLDQVAPLDNERPVRIGLLKPNAR
jgi:hypothetical protein